MDSKKRKAVIAVGGVIIAAGVIGGLAYYLIKKKSKCFNFACNWGIVKDKAKECSTDGSDCIPGTVTAYDASSCAALGGTYTAAPASLWGGCDITWGKKGAISPSGRYNRARSAYDPGFQSYARIMQCPRATCDALGGEYNPVNGQTPGATDIIPCHLSSYVEDQQKKRPTVRLGPNGTTDVFFTTSNAGCKKLGGSPIGDSGCSTRATIYNSF